tara:strand:- start:258 stop:476 length:219 start_codon:yes stop_codon:yes gene_type:complete
MKDLNYDPQTQTAEDMVDVLTATMLEEGEKYSTLEDADEKTKCLEKINECRELVASLSSQPVIKRFRRRTYL